MGYHCWQLHNKPSAICGWFGAAYTFCTGPPTDVCSTKQNTIKTRYILPLCFLNKVNENLLICGLLRLSGVIGTLWPKMSIFEVQGLHTALWYRSLLRFLMKCRSINAYVSLLCTISNSRDCSEQKHPISQRIYNNTKFMFAFLYVYAVCDLSRIWNIAQAGCVSPILQCFSVSLQHPC